MTHTRQNFQELGINSANIADTEYKPIIETLNMALVHVLNENKNIA